MKREKLRWSAGAAGLALLLLTAGCVAGTGTSVGAPPSTSAPSDDVFLHLLKSIEERRADRFAGAVDPTCSPNRDILWEDLNKFLGAADNVEYNVSVERRVSDLDRVVYIFTWQRKHQDRDSGEIVSTNGRSEWTLSRASGRFMLIQTTGTPLF
ncbi:MAG: hypothetical protein AAB229_02725 [Candidatus Hydrogenedentota bacterium]